MSIDPIDAQPRFSPVPVLSRLSRTIECHAINGQVQAVPDATNDALIKSQLLDELLRASKMLTSEEVAVFDEAVQALSDLEFSSRELGVLFSIFADDTPHEEVMWGLLHLVEHSDGDRMVSALVRSAPYMRTVAPEWLRTFIYRLVNSDPDRDRLIACLKNEASTEGAAEVVSLIEALKRDASDSVRAKASLVASALM
ncbi:Imm30 family immunity protein [Stenotrophomonas sp.]|uniref:Imm30 family immunity protein n=1 Tax=Stenotrophomonas sp. TaxID=69392 RepID=UPI00289B3175|nr:Imm30 family immunity protein [Stenotrophomonas sp.]